MSSPSTNPELIAGLLRLLAHDMRNPLSALQSNLNYLVNALADIDRDLKEAAEDAVASCDGLMHVIENMETFSYELGGKDPLPQQGVSFSGMVSEVVERARITAASHDVSVSLQDDVPKAVRVRTNRQMLSRAIENVIRGCVQHCAPKGEVRVVTKALGHGCSVCVVDPTGHQLSSPDLFTAEGQLRAKGGGGRFVRALGFLCAKIAVDAAGATLEVVPHGTAGALEITVPIQP